MDKLCTSDVIDLILEGNQLIKKQAEERHILLKQIIAACETPMTLAESDRTIVEELKEIENEENSEFFKMTRLTYLNTLIGEIDHVKIQKKALDNEINQFDVNLDARNELINILKEYINLEEAAIYRFVTNYGEAQEVIEECKRSMYMYDLLSTNDPRYRALVALKNHVEGISMTQLSFMLGTTQFHSFKIIRELIEMGLVTNQNNLLKIAIPVELDLDLIKMVT